LPYYAILRSILHKAGGIVAMIGAILVLLLIPFSNTSDGRNITYGPASKIFLVIYR
jgi:quinol-cytochrome oxidoreductase complex cytochrome b subunit